MPAHHVGVQVAAGAAVLIVAALVVGHGTTHADGGAPVGHPPAEVVHAGRLVLAGQAALVALTIAGNVQGVLGLQLLDLGLDGIPPSACNVSWARLA